MGKDPDKTIQINPSDLNRHSYTGQLIYIVIAYTTKANNPYRKYIIPIFNYYYSPTPLCPWSGLAGPSQAIIQEKPRP
jgi:hypothetical protein